MYYKNLNFHLSRKMDCLFCALDSFVKRRNLIVKQSNYYICMKYTAHHVISHYSQSDVEKRKNMFTKLYTVKQG